jgi:hypothetical protein
MSSHVTTAQVDMFHRHNIASLSIDMEPDTDQLYTPGRSWDVGGVLPSIHDATVGFCPQYMMQGFVLNT